MSGDRFTLHDEVGTMACEGRPVMDRWSFSGDLLEMESVEDVCLGRTAVLTAHPLRRERP